MWESPGQTAAFLGNSRLYGTITTDCGLSGKLAAVRRKNNNNNNNNNSNNLLLPHLSPFPELYQ